METIQPESLLQNATNESREKHLQRCAEVLTRWFEVWRHVFPNHPIRQAQIAAYLDSLKDLSPEQIERGCAVASKGMEQFPKPGTIRKGIEAVSDTARLEDEKRRHACHLCQGTGWKLVDNGQGGKWAVRCTGGE